MEDAGGVRNGLTGRERGKSEGSSGSRGCVGWGGSGDGVMEAGSVVLGDGFSY